jgi:hypothetical protein
MLIAGKKREGGMGVKVREYFEYSTAILSYLMQTFAPSLRYTPSKLLVKHGTLFNDLFRCNIKAKKVFGM